MPGSDAKKKKRKTQHDPSSQATGKQEQVGGDTVQAETDGSPEAVAEPAIRRKSGKELKRRKRLAEAAAQAEAAKVAAEQPDVPKKRARLDSGGSDVNAARSSGAVQSTVEAVDQTVFVDGVPYTWTLAQIEECFASCGRVLEVRAPTWQDSGRLRGFAHVTFESRKARDKALAMDGTKVGAKGRFLKIEPAKEKAAPVKAEIMKGARRLFVKNLPYEATEEQIGAIFERFGEVREVRVATSYGRSKGFAFVEFAKHDALKAAIKTEPRPELSGRTLFLDVDQDSKGPKAGFHHRKDAYNSGFGPDAAQARGRGKGRGSEGRGRGRGGGGEKLELF